MPLKKCLKWGAACFVAISVLLPTWAVAQAPKPGDNPFPKSFPAPNLDGGTEWLNTGGPISLRELRGKVVLLDFWTFCCINCMHILPDLKYLEQKYPGQLVVIGVHSAKFDNEKESGNIRNAILRYEIEHPVINDANLVLWRKFQINAWPSMVLIDPEGNYCATVPNEGNREALDKMIGSVIDYHKKKGTLDETPVQFDLERRRSVATPLRYPGKVLGDESNGRLFVSDSNNNRIVIASLDGKLIDTVGSGLIGSKDGSYSEARFDHPQGMTLIDDTLFVADTENHQIRTVDLVRKSVATLAGTGKQADFRSKGGLIKQTLLNSPWDLCEVDKVLYIAMAGPHQIWSHRLGSDSIQPYAGSGLEDIRDGSLSLGALAQPSGIATDGKLLYVVDSEGSAVRRITTKSNPNLLAPTGDIKTLVGTHDLPRGASLFAFGDVDGRGKLARLQHPLGIVLHDSGAFIADSYNHKIKFLDFKTQQLTTWAGIKKPGNSLEPVEFAEPAGLAIIGDLLFIADTNNHRILRMDIATKQTSEFKIAGLLPPMPVEEDEPSRDDVREVKLVPQRLAAVDTVEFRIEFVLPPEHKLNPQFPAKYKFTTDSEFIAKEINNVKLTLKPDGNSARIQLPIQKDQKQGTVLISLTYGYCLDGNGGLCKIDSVTFRVPLELGTGDARFVELKASPK